MSSHPYSTLLFCTHFAVLIKTPFCNRPSGTRPSGLFSPTQWKFILPSTQRIFWFYPAVFMLPQWLCGVTLHTQRIFANKQKNKNNKNTLTATTIVEIRTARYIWTRAGKAFSLPDLNNVTLSSVVGLVPIEQHVKDGGIYWQFFQQWNRKRFVLFGLWYWWLSHSKSTWKAKQICTGGGK